MIGDGNVAFAKRATKYALAALFISDITHESSVYGKNTGLVFGEREFSARMMELCKMKCGFV